MGAYLGGVVTATLVLKIEAETGYLMRWVRPDKRSLRLTLIELVSDTLNILQVPDRKKVKQRPKPAKGSCGAICGYICTAKNKGP